MASTNAAAAPAPAAPRKAAAAPTMGQLLGFVFASADMVLEIGAGGVVSFATGASVRLLGRGSDALLGLSWRELFDPADTELVEAALNDLRPGERRGPFTVNLAAGDRVQPASISLFQMPQRGDSVAVALSLCGPGATQLKTDASGLASRDDFETAAAVLLKQAEHAGAKLQVDLLQFTGLAGALSAMEPGAAETVRRKLAAVLRAASYGGLPAADLGHERYALLSAGKGEAETILERVRALAGPNVQVQAGQLTLDAASPSESLRAIRYALDRCIEEGPPAAAKSFEAALHQTVTESTRFKDLLKSGRFELVYQPVVDLKTRKVHHYEALTRFEGGGGPAATIKLAEELGLVVEFDLTIVRNVATMLGESREDVRIAANISAFSLQSPGFVDEVLSATQITHTLRPRLMLELTESHKISDLANANTLIQRLREAGHVVCLDDFGAGAASMDYLRQIEADVVKFDGRFVQAIGTRPRDTIILKRLAELCRELKVATVAEMIETEEAARAVAELGVELGQGWLFGKPVAKPEGMARAPGPVAARRRGEVESWG